MIIISIQLTSLNTLFYLALTKVSNKRIPYAEEFKELFCIDYHNGIQPIEIFKKYGFDPNVLGKQRRVNFTKRIKKVD